MRRIGDTKEFPADSEANKMGGLPIIKLAGYNDYNTKSRIKSNHHSNSVKMDMVTENVTVQADAAGFVSLPTTTK